MKTTAAIVPAILLAIGFHPASGHTVTVSHSAPLHLGSCCKTHAPKVPHVQVIVIPDGGARARVKAGGVAGAVAAPPPPAVAGPFEIAQAAYHRGDYETAFQLFRGLADHGNAEGQSGLGTMYESGQGAPQDYAAAVKWYRKAADQGLADAQASLGYMYANGEGVAQNPTEAIKWFRKAADQGNPRAESGLGSMYANGEGVPQDSAEAARWFGKAADQQ